MFMYVGCKSRICCFMLSFVASWWTKCVTTIKLLWFPAGFPSSSGWFSVQFVLNPFEDASPAACLASAQDFGVRLLQAQRAVVRKRLAVVVFNQRCQVGEGQVALQKYAVILSADKKETLMSYYKHRVIIIQQVSSLPLQTVCSFWPCL